MIEWHPVWGPRRPPRPRAARRFLKTLVARLLARGRSAADPGRGISVLAYHGTGADSEDPWWLDFRGQMQLVEDLGFQVLSLDQVIHLLDRGKPLVRPALAVTFDDGYANNLSVAFPELARRGWPATAFLTTSFLGRRPFLVHEELADLLGLGIEIGNHTHSHPDLSRLESHAIAAELSECSRRIEDVVGRRPRHFCYPSGRFNPQVRAAVASSDLVSACTSRVGSNRPGQDVYALRRLTLERGEGAPALRLRLAGGHDFLAFKQRRLGR